MRTFVISLESAVERHAHIEVQFTGVEQDFEFFDAMGGAKGLASRTLRRDLE
ncbi:glycosyltransferase family 25 protein [Vibrio owensii]|uniref:glycosyltransferase family 25 protein n=1 Tax=Vibrio owensii TaxID=696485 RepID=UPI0038CE27F9